MGTSYVEYKGFGFWSRDSYLESWISAILDELSLLPTLETWQALLMEHWRLQAVIDGGCMSLDLDELLGDATRCQIVLSLAQDALEQSKGEARRTGQLFIELISGRLKTTVSSPIDYL